MRQILKDIIGVLGAFVAWWSMAVLIGLVMYSIWPTTESTFVAGVSLKPQNVPGNLVGFILALYAFRALTKRSETRGS